MLHQKVAIMKLVRNRLVLFVAVILLAIQSQAGTRLYRDLEDVLRLPMNYVVFSAEVIETEFSQRESYDILDCRIDKVTLLRDELKSSELPEQVQFSAYRPAPSSNHKNRSVYSNGSGLEFSLKKGERYIFICSSSHTLVRAESLENEKRILDLLRVDTHDRF